MNKNVVLVQFNKRVKPGITGSELDLIVGMKDYSPEKICSAFSMLSGKDLGLKDVELLLLIIDLAKALEVNPVIPRSDPFGPGRSSPGWPYPNTVMCLDAVN